MPTDFDNIEPVDSRFFSAVGSDPLLSNAAKQRLVEGALSGRLKLENARAQLVAQRQQETLNNLRIERERFALSEARRRAEEEKANTAAAGQVADELVNLLDDPELDPTAKRKKMAEFRLRNADLFAKSPSLQDQFQTLDRALPRPPDPDEVLAQKLAISRERRAIEAADRAAAKEKREIAADAIKEEKEIYEAAFKLASSARLDDEGFGTDATFKTDLDRSHAVGFLQEYAAAAGVEVTPEFLKNATANALLGKVGEVNNKLRGSSSPRQAPRKSDLSHLNLP